MVEAEIAAMEADPDQAPLADREKALLAFVLQAVDAGGSADKADVTKLKGYGWSESDIIDATNQGVGMMTHGRMLEFFQMG